jgi:hypothetical protein
MAGNLAVQQTEGEYLWSWDTSSLYNVGTLPDEKKMAPVASQERTPVPPPPKRRVMPRRVRVVLIIFLIVGTLALTTDGFLLALSIIRHHTSSSPVGRVQTPSENNTSQLLLTPVTATSLTPVLVATQTTTESAFGLSAFQLFFVATAGQADPAPQTIFFTSGVAGGFDWQIITTPPSWLHLSALQGSATTGIRSALMFNVASSGLTPATYAAHLQIKAEDSQGKLLPDGSQEISVTFNVQAPCVLTVTPVKLSFTATLLQPTPPSQTLSLTESGGCARPVNWQISSDETWVTFSSSSGTDSGGGSTITVQVNNANKLVGTSTATLTLQAADSNNAPLSGSPVTITVTVTVTVV